MPENPKVTSKFDRMHGRPRKVTPVSSPGGTTSPGGAGAPVSHSSSASEGAHRSVSYPAGEHGRMERGEGAQHPSHGARRG